MRQYYNRDFVVATELDNLLWFVFLLCLFFTGNEVYNFVAILLFLNQTRQNYKNKNVLHDYFMFKAFKILFSIAVFCILSHFKELWDAGREIYWENDKNASERLVFVCSVFCDFIILSQLASLCIFHFAVR